jgi:TonB family protein
MEWNNRAMIYTAAVYTIIVFILLFFGFSTQLPLPGEGGILINFGEDESGMGVQEPRVTEKIENQPRIEQVKAVSASSEQAQLTQDYEDAPAVKAEKPKKQTTPTTQIKKTTEQPQEAVKPVVDSRAIYGKKTNSNYSGSEGVNGGTGNQGDPNGDVNSDNHSLGGGIGEGISFSLNGRSAISLPPPEFNNQKEGTVVVKITVDRTGRVTNANPGEKGSTTLDSYLLSVAKKAALASRFNSKDDAQQFQTGTITYVFRLK